MSLTSIPTSFTGIKIPSVLKTVTVVSTSPVTSALDPGRILPGLYGAGTSIVSLYPFNAFIGFFWCVFHLWNRGCRNINIRFKSRKIYSRRSYSEANKSRFLVEGWRWGTNFFNSSRFECHLHRMIRCNYFFFPKKK